MLWAAQPPELARFQNPDKMVGAAIPPFAFPGAGILGPVSWGDNSSFQGGTVSWVPEALTTFCGCHGLWGSPCLSACSPSKQKNFVLSRAWEEGGAENSTGKRIWVEISMAAVLQQRLQLRPFGPGRDQ